MHWEIKKFICLVLLQYPLYCSVWKQTCKISKVCLYILGTAGFSCNSKAPTSVQRGIFSFLGPWSTRKIFVPELYINPDLQAGSYQDTSVLDTDSDVQGKNNAHNIHNVNNRDESSYFSNQRFKSTIKDKELKWLFSIDLIIFQLQNVSPTGHKL